MRLSKPKSQRAHVLRLLLRKQGVSERDTNYNGFRSRLTEIRKQVKVEHKVIPFTNQFGHSSTYRKHFIPETSKNKAIRLYNKINAA